MKQSNKQISSTSCTRIKFMQSLILKIKITKSIYKTWHRAVYLAFRSNESTFLRSSIIHFIDCMFFRYKPRRKTSKPHTLLKLDLSMHTAHGFFLQCGTKTQGSYKANYLKEETRRESLKRIKIFRPEPHSVRSAKFVLNVAIK